MQTAYFYLGWIVVNSLFYYAEISFLLCFTASTKKSKHILFYITVNSVLTAMAIYTQLPHFFSIFHNILLFLYAVYFLKMKPITIMAPFIIMFTLSTFIEGFSAVVMRFLSLTLRSQVEGIAFQFILSMGLAIFFGGVLYFITKRYPFTNQTAVSSYLYILLLPCVLMVWAIRTSLGLDTDISSMNHVVSVNGEITSVLYACFWILATLLVFFVIIEVFYKIITLSQQKFEKIILSNKIKEQYSYIEQAKQRNEEYRGFHHDIKNHLVVLSGLLQEKEYSHAEQYLQKLYVTANKLSSDISTGNLVLDVLVWEKIRYAKQNHVCVTCDVQIPKKGNIDDIDLCILFSNGIDNAIRACMSIELECKTIVLTAKQKHQFLLIDITNTIDISIYNSSTVYGTGLKNIQLTAEKYGGTMYIEKKPNRFCLSILLCIE